MRLDPLLRPRSVAVVGASPHPGPGRRVLENLLACDFPGSVYAVNPRYDSLLDRTCYRSLTSLPDRVECVVVAVGSHRVPGVLEEAVSCGVGAAVVLSSGFGELAGRGDELQRQVESLSDRILVAGPNCMGFVNLGDRIAAYSGPIEGMHTGEVALVVQSGAIGCVLVNAMECRGIGLSHHISAGNGLGVGMADYLEFLIDDPSTRVIALYLESVQRGGELLRLAARGKAAGKQVILLQAGISETGRRAAASHTAAVTAAPEIMEAGCRQAGVTLVRDLDEMIACLDLFVHHDPPPAGDAAVVTISGGEAALLGDIAAEVGLPLATFTLETQAALAKALPSYASIANPLDSTGAGIVERDTAAFEETLELVGRDANVGLVVVAQDINNGLSVRTGENLMLQDGVAAAARAAESGVPPYVILSPAAGVIDVKAATVARTAGLPLLAGARSGLAAVRSFLATRQWVGFPSQDVRANLPLPLGMTDLDAFSLLAAYGIQAPVSRLVTSSNDAASAARVLRFPVALKLSAEGLMHKSDVGGVRLGLPDEASVRSAYRDMMMAAEDRLPASAVRGAIVQRMAPDGIELLCGARYDSEFGHVVALGYGGIYAEVFDTIVIRLGPVNESAARGMIAELRGSQILHGLRGKAACDIDGIVAALVGISCFLSEHESSVQEVEINPLLAPHGSPPLALDIVIVRRSARADGNRPAPSPGLLRGIEA